MSASSIERMKFDDALAAFEPVLGLETHVELGTASKMFCSCSAEFGGDPNTHVCPVCLGLPGSMPVVNASAIESTIRMGLSLHCSIASWCRFAPEELLLSRYAEGLSGEPIRRALVRRWLPRRHRRHGRWSAGIPWRSNASTWKRTPVLTHAGGDTGRIHGADYSLVDYNRAGIPLIEIVTKPIVGAGEVAPLVARAYVTELRDLMRALGVSDVRMDQGSLRCDVNVSLAPPGEPWGTRSETKNVNSLRSVERAVRFEIERQAAVLSSGGRVVQETRHFHEDTGETTSGRSKEHAEDYRYFPEPDLVPVAPTADWVEELRGTLPEVPSVRRARLQAQWNISDLDMQTLVNAEALDLVESTIDHGVDQLTPASGGPASSPDRQRADRLDRPSGAAATRPGRGVDWSRLTDKLARQVFEGDRRRRRVDTVVQARGLVVVGDDSTLLAAIEQALADQPDVAEKIQGGKVQAAGAIVGAVMKATKGQADAAKVRTLLLEHLGVDG